MTIDRFEDTFRNLRAGTIIEKDETRLLVQRRKERTDSIAREVNGLGCEYLLFSHMAPGALLFDNAVRGLAATCL
jgi:hypothetical protein